MTMQQSIPKNALSVTEIKPFTALCFTTRATLQALSQYAPSVAQNLHREAARLHLEITGPIQWVYTGISSTETTGFQLEIVLPISQPGDSSDEFAYKTFPAFRCASYTHTGPWSDFGELYNTLFAQLYRDGYQNDGRVREIYTTVDMENPANCVTELQISI